MNRVLDDAQLGSCRIGESGCTVLIRDLTAVGISGAEAPQEVHLADLDALVPLFSAVCFLFKAAPEKARRLAVRLKSLDDKYEELVRCVIFNFPPAADGDRRPCVRSCISPTSSLPSKRKSWKNSLGYAQTKT